MLNLNDIVPADAVLDQDSLPKLRMPNRDGFTTDHGFMRRDGKPDTHNTACMHDCAKNVRLSSEMPDYARDQHGNLAEQTAAIGAARPDAAKSAAASRAPQDLARASACTACHGVSTKLVGPAFREVAARYAGDPDAESRLVAKVKTGGAGTWGTVAMPAQAQVKRSGRPHHRAVDPLRGEVGIRT